MDISKLQAGQTVLYRLDKAHYVAKIESINGTLIRARTEVLTGDWTLPHDLPAEDIEDILAEAEQ